MENKTVAPSPDNEKKTSLFSPSGKDFGDYELIEEIGRGGMGVIFKARHKQLKRIVALKMVIGGQFSSAEDKQRFRVEAEAAACLDHPGIVPVYEFGEFDGRPFFAMKYVEGGPLTPLMGHYSTNLKDGVEVLCKISRAVHHAHQRAILHRDLKPANVLIDQNGEPMVTDLGLAKSTSGESSLTKTGAVLGTPKYMSPEQAAGNQSVTTAADIFSLGAILYELLTGQTPHDGATPVETLMCAINAEPHEPSKLNRLVDKELELICLKALEREPNDRYSSAAAMADDLQCWLDGKSISLRARSFGIQIKRWFRRNHRLTYVLFAVLIGLAFSLPVLANLFGEGNSDLGDVYRHFPEYEKPLLFRIVKLPAWVDDIFGAILVLGIWPMIGFLNALVTRPKSISESLNVGFLTSLFCAVVALMLLGWIFFVAESAEYSGQRLKLLADIAWSPDPVLVEQAKETAETMYIGLEQIPEKDRSKIFTERIVAEQFARGPVTLLRVIASCIGLAVPIIYGTIIAFLLLERGVPIWLTGFRYILVWVSITVSGIAIIMSLGFVGEESQKGIWLTLFLILLVGSMISFLAMRRWRRTPSESNSLATVKPISES